MYNNERKSKSDKRKIDVFRYMVQFLEIYGNENFGQSAEVDWSKVWDYCSKCDMLDFNYEIEEMVYHTESEEQFRDKVFAFLEKQAVEGYPLWRLFDMSEWLSEKCEQELHQIEHQKDLDYFYNTKCYRCKHFRCKVKMVYATPLEPFCIGYYDSLEEFKKIHPNACVRQITHEMKCNYREEIINAAIEKEKAKGRHVWESEFKRNFRFKYKKYDVLDESQEDYGNEWELNPSVLKRCPNFEESDMTPEKFVELWHEIPRYN